MKTNRSKQGTKRPVRRAVLLVVASIGGLLSGTATPAAADPGCAPVVGWCSSTVNDSPFSATAFFNWCWADFSTGQWTEAYPGCSSGGVGQKTYFLTSRGGHTPYNEDWDTFRVDAGWCYIVKFVVTAGPDFTRAYDQRGRPAAYVKVGDESDAHILSQSSSSCP